MVGIMLGDGGLYRPPTTDGYVIQVSINRIDEKPYVDHVKTLIKDIFNRNPSEYPKKSDKSISIRLHSKKCVNYFESLGLKTGDKVKNQVNVPIWIKENKEFSKFCLKGLFDTDGSIYVHPHKSIYLSFRNASFPLAEDFKDICESLGINTQPKITESRVINENTGEIYTGYQVFISSKKNVKKFLVTIDPEKFKDQSRREYIGTTLILLNSDNNSQEKVLNRIKEEKPKSIDRRYSVGYSEFFKKIYTEYGIEINTTTIEEAISESLEYKYKNRNKN